MRVSSQGVCKAALTFGNLAVMSRRGHTARRYEPSQPRNRLKSYAYLFEGLTVRRVLGVTAICGLAAGVVVWLFLNTYGDLLVSALCVGYTSMVLFTIAGNIHQKRVRREAMQIAALHQSGE